MLGSHLSPARNSVLKFFRSSTLLFTEGLAKVKKGGKWFYINQKGEEITSDRFDLGTSFSEGFAAVNKDGKWFFINQKGEEITYDRFDEIWNFSEGLARVKKDNEIYYIDKLGRRIFKH